MNVKLGVCNFCVPGTGVFAPELVAEAGLDGMSLEFGTYDKGFPLSCRRIQDAYLEAARRYNIEYCNIGCSGFDFIPFHAHRGNEYHKIVKKCLSDAINTASYMNIPLVFIPTFGVSTINDEEQFENAVSMFQYACDLASEVGVLIASESVMKPENQIKLYNRVARDNFGIFYDSNNFFYFKGYDQLEVLKQLYDYLIPQLHVKDSKAGFFAGSLLGKGESQFFDVIDYLKEREYSGWIISENLYEEKPLNFLKEDVYATFLEDVEILKKAVN